MNHTTRLKELILADDILVLPGVHDALTAKIAAQAGFSAITLGGYSATACLLGEPDTSQLSLRELADHYARVCDSSDLPVFGDGDTGFGNVTNVRRTVRTLEKAGVAGLFIEDQVFPKRCGHMSGKGVIPVEEMVGKLKAALDARTDPDLMICARTDAIAVNGIDDALERMAIYADVGVDLLFVEAPGSTDDMKRICGALDGPCLANMIEGGATPVIKVGELQEIGYAAVAFPVAVTYAVAHATRAVLGALLRDGTTTGAADRVVDFDEFNQIVGLDALRDREQNYLDFASTLIENAKSKSI